MALLKALAEATSTPHDDQETIFDDDNFQLNFEDDKRSPARSKTLQQLCADDLKRQHQRVTSFHGYEQDNRSFLDVTGAAARIPQTTTRQLRDLKLSVVKEKKKLQDKKTQELLEILQKQQEHTRTAHHQHQQFSKTFQQQKHSRVVSTQLLALNSIRNHDNCNNMEESNEVAARKATRATIPLQLQESYYEQNTAEELMHLRRPVLATLNFDARVLPSSPPKPRKSDVVDSDGDLLSVSTNNEEDIDISDADDDGEQVRRRWGDRQREVFASSAANGLFLGGGFIAKRTKNTYEKKNHQAKTQPSSISNNTRNHHTQAVSEREFLETVLSAHSASILPLAETNKPALRRREASAGLRRSKHQHKFHPDKKITLDHTHP